MRPETLAFVNRAVRAERYLRAVLAAKSPTPADVSRARRGLVALTPILRHWAGPFILELRPSGSFAKQTAVRGGTDLDIFVSLRSTTPGALRDIYGHLVSFLGANGL